MHQSIPAVPISHLLTLSVPGVGHSEFYCSPGPGHMTHVFESASTMDEFIGKDETFVKQWYVFLNWDIYSFTVYSTCNHINLSNDVNYICLSQNNDINMIIAHMKFLTPPLQVVPFRYQTLDVLKPGAMLRPFHYCFTRICDVYNENKNIASRECALQAGNHH